MRCPRCGKDNDGAATTCVTCGVELRAASGEPAGPETRPPSDLDATVLTGGDSAADVDDPQATVPSRDRAGDTASADRAAPADRGRTGGSADPPSTPTRWSRPGDRSASLLTASGTLPEGAVLGGRYRIDAMLGSGGMGSVYRAFDSELDRPVALKLIRSDLASNAMVLQRFKQEIILSREVTHPNVVRIFDLGTSEGLRYVTMEFVPGRDLKDTIVEDGKIPPERAVGLMLQITRALTAAHDAGIVHRDLKPQNVMVTEEGVAKVMDFGIARSADVAGMTGTGEMLGTPTYMSPEQARGEPADARSDVFSLGIVFYEMLTGTTPFAADTAMGTIMKRLHEDARPPRALVPELPDWLDGVIVKCLERDPDLRYQRAADILADLEQHRAPAQATVFDRVPSRIRAMSPGGRRMAAGTLVAMLLVTATVAYVAANWTAAPGPVTEAPAIEPVGLAILPFRNASGDTSLDWIGDGLGEMLRTDIGQSAYLRTVPTERVHQILADLRLGSGAVIDPATLDRVANFTGADMLVTGQYLRAGDRVRIDATLHDLAGSRQIPLKVEAESAETILPAVNELAAAIRAGLDLGAEAVAAMEATSFTPSTDSVQALQLYNEGLQHQRDLDYPAAAAAFAAAVEADPDFALAHARLGSARSALGRDGEAEGAARAAEELAAGASDFERRLIDAILAAVTHDTDAAIAAYRELVAAAPADPDLRFQLVSLLEQRGDFGEARELLTPALAVDPEAVSGLYLQGRIETRSGDPQAAIDTLEQALEITEKTGSEDGRGRILNSIGFAHMFLNRSQEALDYFDSALEVFRGIDQKQGVAAALSNRGRAKAVLGELDEALASFEEALALQRQIGDRSAVGTTLMNMGNYWANRGDAQRAIDTYKQALQVQREVGNDVYAAVCLNNIGTVYYDRSEYADALTWYEQAYALRQGFGAPADLGQSLHNIGETQLLLGNYEQALDYLLQAIDQWRSIGDEWGIAAESYDIGIIRGYQGRYAAALEAESDAVRVFTELGSRDVWRYYTTGQHGIALAEIGRLDEAETALVEAMTLAEELENGSLIAQAWEWQGQAHLMRGDTEAARSAFTDALKSAGEAEDARAELSARLRLAMLDVAAGNAPETAAESIAAMTDEARRAGLAYTADEATLYRARALIDAGDLEAARNAIQPVQRNAERYSLDPLLAFVHHLAASAAAAAGDDAERARQLERAAAALDRIAAGAEDEDPFRRSDLSALRQAVSG